MVTFVLTALITLLQAVDNSLVLHINFIFMLLLIIDNYSYKIYVLSIVKNFCLSAHDFASMQKISITIYHSYSNSIRVGAKCVKLSIALKTHIFYSKIFNIAIVQKMLNMCKILSFHIGC